MFINGSLMFLSNVRINRNYFIILLNGTHTIKLVCRKVICVYYLYKNYSSGPLFLSLYFIGYIIVLEESDLLSFLK